MDSLLTTTQVANILGVCTVTVRRYADEGKMTPEWQVVWVGA